MRVRIRERYAREINPSQTFSVNGEGTLPPVDGGIEGGIRIGFDPKSVEHHYCGTFSGKHYVTTSSRNKKIPSGAEP
jgi:hypothetical protein